MLDFATAQDLVEQQVVSLPPITESLWQALGRRLATDVVAKVESPRFAKSMMDGYAIQHASLQTHGRELQLVGAIMAGDAPSLQVRPGEAVAIMTGAPLPLGADTVVMREHAQPSDDGGRVHLTGRDMVAGQHVLSRGAVFSSGQCLVPAGQLLAPAAIGLLLEAGVTDVAVYPRPAIAVVTTGSELCPADSTPGPGQIRNTNGPVLVATLAPYGRITDLGIAPDDRASLRDVLAQGLTADVLLVTGGVSTGDLDLVPGVLQELGVRQVFHKVALKPGKPVWFGVGEERGQRCLVFGLPGNPVSALACCALFVFPALRYLAGAARRILPCGCLSVDHAIRGDRPTFWPAMVEPAEGRVMIRPLPWLGSADQRCLTETNGLAYFPRGDQTYPAGSILEYVPLSVW